MKRKKEPAKRIYLDDYILQKDMRVRMPKEIIKNMNVKPGESYFEVYFEPDKQEIVLTVNCSSIFFELSHIRKQSIYATCFSVCNHKMKHRKMARLNLFD